MRLVLRLVLVLLQQGAPVRDFQPAVLVAARMLLARREVRREDITRRAGRRLRQPGPRPPREDAPRLRPFVQGHVQRFSLAPVEVALGSRLRAFRNWALLLGELLDFVQQLPHLGRGAGGPRGRIGGSQVGQTAYVGARHAVGDAVGLLDVGGAGGDVRGGGGHAHGQVEEVGEVVLLFLALGVDAAVFG